MTIAKAPFRLYTLDADKKEQQGKIFTIRLNGDEYKKLVEMMIELRISNASSALKFLFIVGRNVIHTTFKPEDIRWLADGNRRVDDAKLNQLLRKRGEL